MAMGDLNINVKLRFFRARIPGSRLISDSCNACVAGYQVFANTPRVDRPRRLQKPGAPSIPFETELPVWQ